ncbi:tRNA-modifying protein YgfZ [Erwinia sp. OLTSP20]|uniref:tRNA-modifying protein YgfZ n=1 Tax=unclassified Erwinia TaxID=2622719 RepID=UPI000C18DC0C|nr:MULTISPECIES: tRNA-modifying protein YgfZ [unclassified Erwinia]PIJ49072.1 tRNA-modifying protein YgfZ [Erwinia sp. OAMSP11]PIJ75059.1 tRNA-modifying protein YgfZ [Erwinia sp. OLSSP12]PIJ79756.1 tRNA-modifying protein YgfZ [Erwinia sp. OLCASP19]PIJ80541.1 tRNA-modifying protein YgfZ [Erwinia sp. OLMTSP26]PIJ82655.1 tRNA-modifying protein YgfZ [Erwinia sp. OLMDSP33]
MTRFAFPPRQPAASTRLPLTLISLEEWALVNVSGPDAVSYLQGQLTLDVAALQKHQHRPVAHCDAKGKMWSNLRLFWRGEQLAYLVRRSVEEKQLAELKKYAIFAKLTLSPAEDVVLLGVAGFGAKAALSQLFTTLPDAENQVVTEDDTTLLFFSQPEARFLLVLSAEKAGALQQALGQDVCLNNSQQWLALDIEAGLPIIDIANSEQFIPQAVNLQALDAISFRKGCYTGQEMVARAKYRGANKRALYWLAGQAGRIPQSGDALEMQLGENWRRTGTILSAVQLDDGQLWLQAVLNNDLQPETVLRVQGDEQGLLHIQPLPYRLTEED